LNDQACGGRAGPDRQRDPANAAAYEQAMRVGMDGLHRAAERAGQLAAIDPTGLGGRGQSSQCSSGDILIELGDAQQVVRQFKEAAATYQQTITENNNPERGEEPPAAGTSLHLAGQFRESDVAAQKFAQTYPRASCCRRAVQVGGECLHVSQCGG